RQRRRLRLGDRERDHLGWLDDRVDDPVRPRARLERRRVARRQARAGAGVAQALPDRSPGLSDRGAMAADGVSPGQPRGWRAPHTAAPAALDRGDRIDPGRGALVVHRRWREALVTADLVGRTYVITGANTGVGRATAEALAARGARLLLACRSL